MDHKEVNRNIKREQIRNKIQNSRLDDKKRIVIPAEETRPFTDQTVGKRVCAYCRVSTDDPAQTTSYELQKKYYEEQINNTPGWTFAGIYADEGISATSLKNRDEFNRMIEDCRAGKIDVIITKNVSRFARNVVDCLSVVRKLAQLNPPVGVKFETEGFFSLDNTSEMILTVIAAAAQEESKTKSTAMNWSLEKRFDNGNFLTPVLLGYDHDDEGNLVINPKEAVTVKMIFYLFLSGFLISEIAQILTELQLPTKKGNTRWSGSAVREILKNERHCGNILSWKTYTYDFWEHKKRKNRKNRKQVLEIDHHEGIVSHEIFDAAQAKLQTDRFSRTGKPLPTISVVDGGILKGYVTVDRCCQGFTDQDYRAASESAYRSTEVNEETYCSGKAGIFTLDGYEIARSQFFTTKEKPIVSIGNGRVSFNTTCLKKFENIEYVELLINTVEKCIAIRPCSKDNPNAFAWGKKRNGRWVPLPKSISGFANILYSITGWDQENRYRLLGQYLSDGDDQLILFDLSEPEIYRYVKKDMTAATGDDSRSDHDHKDDSPVSAVETGEAGQEMNITVIDITREFPPEWDGHFGIPANKTAISFERLPYSGTWEILRPALLYSTLGGVSVATLDEIQKEAQQMLSEMGYAV